jgi:hypothetical protein
MVYGSWVGECMHADLLRGMARGFNVESIGLVGGNTYGSIKMLLREYIHTHIWQRRGKARIR